MNQLPGVSGFSVAFGSAGCRGSAGGLAPFVRHALMFSAGVTNFRGSRGMLPMEIFYNRTLKCNFLRSGGGGAELVKWKVF